MKVKTKESKIKAFGSKILIEVESPERITESGIILQPKKDEVSGRGVVVSVGEEIKDINEGNLIFFNKFTGAEIEYNKFKYLVIRKEDIHAVVN